MIALTSWLITSVVIITIGKLCNSKAIIGIGATMLLMMSMVVNID